MQDCSKPIANGLELPQSCTKPSIHGPLTRYVKFWVAHAPGMPGTFSPPPRVSDPDMHHGTCVTHVPWCMPGSLTSGFLWSQWWGKRPRHSRRMHNPQFCVSGKRPMAHAFVVLLCYGTGLTTVPVMHAWKKQINHSHIFHNDCYTTNLIQYTIKPCPCI